MNTDRPGPLTAALTAGLAADLADLTVALDRPGVDLADALHAFGTDVGAAIDTYLGLSVTMFSSGLPFTVTVLEPRPHEATAAASLLVPLSAARATQGRDTLVLYAMAPGAFAGLAAGLAAAMDVAPDTLCLDRHLVLPDPRADTGLGDIASINQAIGVLVARGATPDTARVELRARAARGATSVLAAAQQVLAELRGRRD